jgi:APA family basic amino acid/polyamine antiporter
VILGPILGSGHTAAAPFSSAGSATVSGFGVALSPVIFSYLGWNASVYVAGEIAEPGRNLPRSLFWGLGICTTIYLLVTATFVYGLGMEKIVGMPDVGFQAGRVLFGEKGSLVVAAMILASAFGCLNANTLVGPRIVYAMAQDRLFFRDAARLSETSRTPWVAVIAQSMTATVLVLVFTEMPRVLDYTTFAIVLATIADTTALYVLRRREPERERPYRAAGYPVVPMLYILANVGIAISMMVARPVECLTGLGVLFLGAPVYWLFARRHFPFVQID